MDHGSVGFQTVGAGQIRAIGGHHRVAHQHLSVSADIDRFVTQHPHGVGFRQRKRKGGRTLGSFDRIVFGSAHIPTEQGDQQADT